MYLVTNCRNDLLDRRGNCFHFAHAVDPAQQTFGVIVTDQWRSVLVVGQQTLPDRVGIVITAPLEFS